MMRRAAVLTVLLSTMLGCATSRSRVIPEEGESFSRYRHVGVPSFVDRHGQGAKIADDLAVILQRQFDNEPVERAALEQVLSKYKKSTEDGLGVEALEDIHDKATADAVIFGRVAPDWSAVRLTVVEAQMGGLVLRAVIMPPRGKTVFTSPEQIALETAHALGRAN